MVKQLHKRFSTKEVRDVLKRYSAGEVGREQAMAILKIGRRRFFDLLKAYRNSPEDFKVSYGRKGPTRKIDTKVEEKIMAELERESKLIKDKRNPVRDYNYSYIKEVLKEDHDVTVSLPTIIRRAKKRGFIKRGDCGRIMTEKC